MAEFKESEHPRDKDGKFTKKSEGKQALDRILARRDKRNSKTKITLSKSEWRQWYDAIGYIKQGLYVPMYGDKYLVQINNKIVITDANYGEPRAESVLEFENSFEADVFLERCIK